MDRHKHNQIILGLATIIVLASTAACGQKSLENKPKQTTSPLTAEISIDASRVIRTIPPELFGANIEWTMNMQGIWLAEKNCIDPEILQLSKESGLALFRYPGGTGADYYDWEKGIGPAASRQQQRRVISEGSEVNLFGTDELLSFCEKLEAKAILTVNLITESSEKAANWVAYCNRQNDYQASRKVPSAVQKIAFWELANEPYMKADNPNTRASSISAEEYVRKSKDFIDAMRRKDASVKIAAVGGSDFTRYSFLSDRDWNQKILKQLGNKIDVLSLHTGYAPLIIENTDYSLEDVYSSLLAFPKLMDENLNKVSREIDDCVKPSPSKVSIAVTEWAPLFHVATTSPWVDHPKTFGSGLYTALVLQSLIRNPRVSASTFFKLKDFLFGGIIGFNNVPKSSFYALKMYSALRKQNLLACKTESPTYDAKAVGLIPEIKQVPLLDTISTMHPQRKTLSICAINRSIDTALRTHIEIKDYKPKPGCKITIFDAANLDSNNGKDIPDVPGYSWAHQKEATHNPQFQQGRPGTLQLQTRAFSGASNSFDFTFPPHSAVCLTLESAI